MGQRILEIAGLRHRLFDADRDEEFTVHVDDPLRIEDGDFVAVLGPSGCGKTTLLTVLGLLRVPTFLDELDRFSLWTREADGEVVEHDLKDAWRRRQSRKIEQIRRQHIGFALQGGELLPALTVQENIAAPLMLNGVSRKQARRRVDELMAAFDLRKRFVAPGDGDAGIEETRLAEAADVELLDAEPVAADHQQAGATPPQDAGEDEVDREAAGIAEPAAIDEAEAAGGGNDNRKPALLASARVNKLSGGEYQRVSLARAIAHEPTLIFVDEPTAALNRELARGALTQLGELQRGEGRFGATIMITHDELLAEEFANVVVRMAPLSDRPAGHVCEVVRREPLEAPVG